MTYQSIEQWQDDLRKEGYAARLNGEALGECPYGNPDNRNLWRQGWLRCDKNVLPSERENWGNERN